ncbi:MAG: DUF4258 domain-containing protein [Candidatus Latescibacteria bacterium]|nr:DUF4258 domain-containing protein [Candidatus Latescibacterota bacterium]
MKDIEIRLTEGDLHPHLRARMYQRGVTQEDIERTLKEGWEATDTKPVTSGKLMVFPYEAEWEGQFCQEKEVTVYYKVVGETITLLTVKARYDKAFPRRA